MTQHIHDAANQLAREGKKPSVALIKSRLKQPASMRDIIETLKVWRFDPDSKPEAETAAVTVTHKSTDIAAAIAPLQQEIQQLQQEVQALKTELKTMKQALLTG